MPSYLNVPTGASSAGTASSFTLVGTNSPAGEAIAGTFSFAELEGKDPSEQVRFKQ
jgi:hypothetical protein